MYVVHVGRPYGLTSFVQQSGRGGRNGEVSESVIITRVESSHGRQRQEIMSEYSVEQIDEDAMTEFIQSRGCRRQVLSRYMDGETSGSSCSQIDGVFCDRCKVTRPPAASPVTIVTSPKEEEEESGSQVIARRLQDMQAVQDQMMAVMGRLQGNCIYCGLIQRSDCPPHSYDECVQAEAGQCGRQEYGGKGSIWDSTSIVGSAVYRRRYVGGWRMTDGANTPKSCWPDCYTRGSIYRASSRRWDSRVHTSRTYGSGWAELEKDLVGSGRAIGCGHGAWFARCTI